MKRILLFAGGLLTGLMTMTAAIGIFWVLRAANQVIFYGLFAPGTLFWVIFCLLVGLLYLVPTVWNRTAIRVVPAS
jgi:fatty acid desaturase